MYILEVQTKSLFAKLKDVFPECELLIAGEDQLFPLRCLQDTCHRNANCMDKLARRVKYIFDTFKEAELLILYFSYQDKPGSTRAGVFWRDLREPRLITLNRAGWKKCKEMGQIYEWTLPESLFLSNRAP